MKIINEKGKLFGIINVVDLLVVVALLAIIGGVGWKVLGPKVTASAPNATLTYTVRVRAINVRMQDEIRKNLDVDPRLIAGNDYVQSAKVTNVIFEPYKQQNPNDQGLFVDATDPTRVDAVFTVEAQVPKNTPIIKVGPQEIRAGTGHFLKTKYIEFAATIETVTLDG